MGGSAPSGRHSVDTLLLLRHDGFLRNRVLAADDSQTFIGPKRSQSHDDGRPAVRRGLRDSAIERLALRSRERASLACCHSRACVWSSARACRFLSKQLGPIADSVRCRWGIVLWVPAGLLGGADSVPQRVRGRSVDWPYQCGRQSRRFGGPNGDGLLGQTDSFLLSRPSLSGREFIHFWGFDARNRKGTERQERLPFNGGVFQGDLRNRYYHRDSRVPNVQENS